MHLVGQAVNCFLGPLKVRSRFSPVGPLSALCYHSGTEYTCNATLRTKSALLPIIKRCFISYYVSCFVPSLSHAKNSVTPLASSLNSQGSKSTWNQISGNIWPTHLPIKKPFTYGLTKTANDSLQGYLIFISELDSPNTSVSQAANDL